MIIGFNYVENIIATAKSEDDEPYCIVHALLWYKMVKTKRLYFILFQVISTEDGNDSTQKYKEQLLQLIREDCNLKFLPICTKENMRNSDELDLNKDFAKLSEIGKQKFLIPWIPNI